MIHKCGLTTTTTTTNNNSSTSPLGALAVMSRTDWAGLGWWRAPLTLSYTKAAAAGHRGAPSAISWSYGLCHDTIIMYCVF